MLGKSVSEILALGNELRRQEKAKGAERDILFRCYKQRRRIISALRHAQQSGHQLLGNEQEAHQN